MRNRMAIVTVVVLALASIAAAIPVTPVAARGGALSDLRQRQAQMDGSQNDMFRRHFFRGQAYHGTGYAAQVNELPRSGVVRGVEAMVEPGTPGAAIARTAANCSARYKTYDASTGTYIARDGAVRRCR